ncbi:ISL3 family transposase [Candidatus Spongiisocius sp.]|uniref:ISL3 family transposase n=1 Tax=Candidatus Spongiisocius sp. TaxID=3101273 RepID=UPI003B5BEB53
MGELVLHRFQRGLTPKPRISGPRTHVFAQGREVRTAWHAKETVRGIYQIDSIPTALRYTLQLADDLQHESCPPEINKLGRTIARWTPQIANWHISKVTNGPTEALNNLIKRIKRTAFGFRNFANYRIRALLYAGKPNWNLLTTITPH